MIFLDDWVVHTIDNFDVNFHLVTRLQKYRRVTRSF